MEVVLAEGEFAGGIEAVQGLHARETARRMGAMQRLRVLARDPNCDDETIDAAVAETEALPPLWQRICGFSPRNELQIPAGTRRAGIRRLLRVFERLFRAELRSEDTDADGSPAKLDEDVSYAQRASVWDPLNEICVYLEISKAKLNALAAQRTGLRASEIGDCIRAEKLRAHLKETLEPLAWQWFGQLDVEGKHAFAADFENAPWRFLKWVRGRGAGEARRKLAFELGLASREKLNRAALVCEGEELEAIELRVARAVLRAVQEAGRPAGDGEVPDLLLDKVAHGAGCDEPGMEHETEGGRQDGDAGQSKVRRKR